MGSSTFNPDGTNDISFVTDGAGGSNINITNLSDSAGTVLCLDSSNNLVTCSGQVVSLQNAYDGGNTITTNEGDDIAFTLDSGNFSATAAAGTDSFSQFALANGANANPAGQIVLVENLDTN